MPTGTSTTSRPSGRPRGADTAARREDILRVAAELFSVDGYRGTSMSRVAKAAGISHTGLVHHFPTKDDLLGAVMDRRDELDTARAFADAGDRPRGWDYVHAMVQLVRNNEATVRRLRNAFQQAAEAGQLAPDAPVEAMCRLIVAAMDGLQTQWLTGTTPGMADELACLVDAFEARWRR
ncbi:TetR/AcrR family transcriptional regulator [Kocuria varians]|uniref:TetR/AcrR family transcriptional regulator n=1 Tax=Kocuria varians TaxID=1272 RepID=UPI000838D1D7|nr:TetR/AcrR family transcriptional regulator [Kocuria varians]